MKKSTKTCLKYGIEIEIKFSHRNSVVIPLILCSVENKKKIVRKYISQVIISVSFFSI